ncbi:MAG TPA: hypothetical protein VNU68_12670 [Verrucomicrobiae bacterium]|nr:hypothetical protein [Verrucomicrobiae bacterium]
MGEPRKRSETLWIESVSANGIERGQREDTAQDIDALDFKSDPESIERRF